MTDQRLPPEGFQYLGLALFGKFAWHRKMASELKVNAATVKQWASEGPPASAAAQLSHIAGYYRGQIQAAMAIPGMPQADLNAWERADRLLQEYEGLSPDPTMIYSRFDDNMRIVVRVIADMLHYCHHQIIKNQRYIDMDAIIKEATALYNSEPHPEK